MKNNFL